MHLYDSMRMTGLQQTRPLSGRLSISVSLCLELCCWRPRTTHAVERERCFNFSRLMARFLCGCEAGFHSLLSTVSVSSSSQTPVLWNSESLLHDSHAVELPPSPTCLSQHRTCPSRVSVTRLPLLEMPIDMLVSKRVNDLSPNAAEADPVSITATDDSCARTPPRPILLGLPRELREMIVELAFTPTPLKRNDSCGPSSLYFSPLVMLRNICQALRAESQKPYHSALEAFWTFELEQTPVKSYYPAVRMENHQLRTHRFAVLAHKATNRHSGRIFLERVFFQFEKSCGINGELCERRLWIGGRTRDHWCKSRDVWLGWTREEFRFYGRSRLRMGTRLQGRRNLARLVADAAVIFRGIAASLRASE